MKILIVDDQIMMLKTLEIKFVKEGYEVITANNVEEALAILAAQNIDVVLTEIHFTNTIDFQVLIAAKRKDYNIVVIVISIRSLEESIIEAFEAGAEEYMIKPVNLNLLSVRIRKLLKVKKTREILAKSIPPAERQNILMQLAALNPLDLSTRHAPLQELTAQESDEELNSDDHDLIRENDTDPTIAFKTNGTVSLFENGLEHRTSHNTITYKRLKHRFIKGLELFATLFLCFLLLFIIERSIEVIADSWMHGTPKMSGKVYMYGLIKDLVFCFHIGILILPFFICTYFLNKKVATFIFMIISLVIVIIHICLSQYFLTTLIPLGADFWNYSAGDIKQTIQASGALQWSTIFMLLISGIVIISTLSLLPRRIKVSKPVQWMLVLIMIISLFISNASLNKNLLPGNEYSNNLSLNKSWFFYNASWDHFFPPSKADMYSIGAPILNHTPQIVDSATNLKYLDPALPFLHIIDTSRNVLSPFFDSAHTAPNIVVIIVEGLGRALTNKLAYLGSFTPFLDSISEHGLYWPNFLSEGGRTFAVLPSILGSLPFNKTGFNSMGDHMPSHISLLSILKKNGYNTSFYYGGDSHFDNMDVYMNKNEVDQIYDEKTFPRSYLKMPASESGFSWGYGDKELFRRYFDTKQNISAPFASVLLTVSTHSPFLVNNQQYYLAKFNKRLEEIKMDAVKKTDALNYKNQYATILFMDDALRGFIEQYKHRPDFNNTIFIITGDHRMPEIPMTTKLDRYHVPLIIYSSLIKRTAVINSISTHFDITPSVVMLLHNKYGLKIPYQSQWIGSGIDTNVIFRNVHTYPFKQVQSEGINDLMKGDHFLNENNLFKIYSSMDIEPEQNTAIAAELTEELEDFKRKNESFIRSGKLIPDSLAAKWGTK